MAQPRCNGSSSADPLDAVRIIRRCRRCFVYGCIGLVPIVGAGLAFQALRLRSQISAELGEDGPPPATYAAPVIGLLLLWGSDRLWGLAGDAVVGVVILGVQAYGVWRSLSKRVAGFSRGRRELMLGTMLAQAGLAMSIWAMGLLIIRIASALPSP